MMVPEHISVLYVEADEPLARMTQSYLEANGVVVTLTSNGREGLAEALRLWPDVVVLEVALPELDGVELCRQLRDRADVPIIMVSARGEEADRVLGLESGADDYVPKPFSFRELLARVRAQARRSRGETGPSNRPITVGSLTVDPAAMRVTLGSVDLELTTSEFQLLRALAEQAGRVLTREHLLELVHGSSEQALFRSIDVHVSRLRAKLGENGRSPRSLVTVRGVGYKLAADLRG